MGGGSRDERTERKGEGGQKPERMLLLTALTSEDKRWKERRETSVKTIDGLLVIGNNS